MMSLLEGHGDVTMDRAGAAEVPGAATFTKVLHERRTNARGFTKVMSRLLGLEAKMRQYAEGEQFVESVEAAGGPELLARVWRGPEWLPTLAEIRSPGRVGGAGRWRVGVSGVAGGWPRWSAISCPDVSFPPRVRVLDCAVSGGPGLPGPARPGRRGRLRGHGHPRGPWPAGGIGRRSRRGRPRGRARRGAVRGREGRRSPPDRTSRRGRAPPGSRRCPPGWRPGTPWTTRPRRSCSTCCGVRAPTGWPAWSPGTRHPLLGLRRQETHAVCAAMGLEPVARPEQR